jgi:hypothetical protein
MAWINRSSTWIARACAFLAHSCRPQKLLVENVPGWGFGSRSSSTIVIDDLDIAQSSLCPASSK